MISSQYNPTALAKLYAKQHLETDTDIRSVHYLPSAEDDRKIRLVEISDEIGELRDEELTPVDFVVDRGEPTEHTLYILDLTSSQWDRVLRGDRILPAKWSIDDKTDFERTAKP